jgi:single-strand DNA-binding protein
MYNFNKVILMGRLTRDPELVTFENGDKVVNFGIAINRKKKTSFNGNGEEEVCYVDCKAWGERAGSIKNHFSKGRPILIEGRLQYDKWIDSDSNQRSRLIVIVNNFEFVDPKPDQNSYSNTFDSDTFDSEIDVKFDNIENHISQKV